MSKDNLKVSEMRSLVASGERLEKERWGKMIERNLRFGIDIQVKLKDQRKYRTYDLVERK